MMKELFDKLKQRLREWESSYVEHLSMCGDTESGFHDEDIFDIDKLMAEIDEFAATFQPGGENGQVVKTLNAEALQAMAADIKNGEQTAKVAFGLLAPPAIEYSRDGGETWIEAPGGRIPISAGSVLVRGG